MGIFKIKERTSCRKFYFFGIMVYCIRYTESCLQHYLFGLPIFRKRKFFVLDDNILHLDTGSFHSLTLDDSNILNELQSNPILVRAITDMISDSISKKINGGRSIPNGYPW